MNGGQALIPEITYAKAGDLFAQEVAIVKATGDWYVGHDVYEIDTREGWLVRYAKDEHGKPLAHPDSPDEWLLERIEFGAGEFWLEWLDPEEWRGCAQADIDAWRPENRNG